MSVWNTTLQICCAVCKKPVGQIEREYDLQRRETIFTVYCHGQSERVALRDALMREADGIAIHEAFAHERKALEP